ncbi:hypothetical protein V8E53_015850 [Lactarius tabidus]
MPASAASANGEKRAPERATSVAQTRSALPSPTQKAGEPNKAQPKQTNKYTDALQTLSGVLHLMAERYKMPDNVAKALGHVAVAIHHIEPQQRKCEGTATLPALIKELQVGLNAEIDAKLSAMEKGIAFPPLAQEKLENTTKQLNCASHRYEHAISLYHYKLQRCPAQKRRTAIPSTQPGKLLAD